MSVVVTISNEANLNKARNLLGAKNESETVELALEKVIEEFESKQPVKDLPEDFFEELFAEDTNLGDGESIQAVIEEREETDIDVHTLNRIPPKRTYEIEAEFEFVGRGKPMKYDLSDYNFDEYETDE